MIKLKCFFTLLICIFIQRTTSTGKLKCRKNEVLLADPGPCADRFCPITKDLPHRPCSRPPFYKLPPRCVCRFNYSRNRKGKCIPTRSCPPIKCGYKEIFDSCPSPCPSDDCSQATPTGECPIIGHIGIVVQCRPQCRCIPNYWRKNNVCVPYEECNPPPPCNATIENI